MARFVGSGAPLTADGVDQVYSCLEAPPPAVWAVVATEASGCGFLPDRRPKILFERHIFSRLTKGAYDADHPDVSAPTAGGYGTAGEHQYERLAAALSLDEAAALGSASWGLGQVLGINHDVAGYADVKAMVDDFVSGEDRQLLGMARFIAANATLKDALQDKAWKTFARIYNGPNYAANNYDGHLEVFCAQFTSHGLPDLAVRAAQVWLRYRGQPTGGVDGVLGQQTRAAIMAFQQKQKLPVTGDPDPATLAALAML